MAEETQVAPTAGTVDTQKANIDAIVRMLLSRSMGPQAGGMAQPMPRYSPEQMKQQPYDMSVRQGAPYDKGAKTADVGQALYNFGTFVNNAVAQHKQNQVRDAMSEWEGFDRALQKAQLLAGDPSAPDYQQKVQQILKEDPYVKANLDPSNPKAVKRLKNMYKALNVDLLDSDGENVHRKGLAQYFKSKEALQKVQQAKQRQEQFKQQQTQQSANAGMNFLTGGSGQQAQLPQQPQKSPLDAGVSKLANLGTVKAPDQKQLLEIGHLMVDAMTKAADKYQIMLDAQGNIVAVDKTNPQRGAIRVKDQNGDPVVGTGKGKVGPALVDGVPIGMYRNGRLLTSTSPEWTAQDASDFASAKAGYAQSEAAKNARVKMWSESREAAYLASRMYPAVDAQGNTYYVSGAQIKSNPGAYAPANIGEKVQRANAIIGPEGEIETTKKILMDAIQNVGDAAFDPKARAMISYVLKSPDPSGSWTQFLQSDVAANLTDKQIDYVTALVSMQESALSLRTVAGMGQGSDSLRGAIGKMLPSAGTPSQAYALRQMAIFDAEVKALRKSVLNIGLQKPSSGGVKTYGAGEVPN